MTLFSHRAHEDPAEDAARLLTRMGVFLLFVVALTAPVPVGRTIYILLPIGAAVLLAGAAVSPFTREKIGPLWRLMTAPPVLAAAFIVAFAALSLTWTPFPGAAEARLIKTALTLALVAVAAGFLPTQTRVCDLNLLPIGAAIAALALLGAAELDHFHPRPLSVEELVDGAPAARAGLALALILWPAAGALALRSHWRYAAALVVVAAAAAVVSGAPNVAPALGAGVIAFSLSFGRVRPATRFFGLAAAGVILAAPLIAMAGRYAPGAHATEFSRGLDIWGALAINGGLRSLTGHGFGASQSGLFGGYLDPYTPRGLLFQIWFDLGIVGGAALAFMAWRAFVVVGGLRPALAPFLVAGLVTGLVVAMLGPAAEQLWAVTAAGLAALAYVLAMRGQFRKRRPSVPAGRRPRVDSIPYDEGEA